MSKDFLNNAPMRVIGQTRPTTTLADRIQAEALRRKWAPIKRRVKTRPRGFIGLGKGGK